MNTCFYCKTIATIVIAPDDGFYSPIAVCEKIECAETAEQDLFSWTTAHFLKDFPIDELQNISFGK
jgi:hypothetical protein